MNNSTEDTLRTALESHGAREFEVVALTMDAGRGLAALNYALTKGAERPVSYAIKLFDSPDWHPSGETRRVATNLAVDVICPHCGGDRFVVVATRQPEQTEWMRQNGIRPSSEPIEEYAPCKVCNAGVNTTRWVENERRETQPA